MELEKQQPIVEQKIKSVKKQMSNKKLFVIFIILVIAFIIVWLIAGAFTMTY